VSSGKGMKRRVIGFDIHTTRVQQLREGVDVTQEVSREELAEVSQLSFTTELEDLRECSVFIITVPTPIDEFKTPDLTPLIKASETVGQVLKAGDIKIGDGFEIRPLFSPGVAVTKRGRFQIFPYLYKPEQISIRACAPCCYSLSGPSPGTLTIFKDTALCVELWVR